jgi:nucleotide-binding universal stress UspA family protein
MLPPQLIMAPVDFSKHSDEGTKTAIELAALYGSELCLVHVVPAIPKLPSPAALFHEGEYEEELLKDAQKRLDEIVQQVSEGGVTAKGIVGKANDTGGEILRIAEDNHVDLIVISTHGMTGWHKLAFGSVAEKVVRLATCPVLVLRAQPTAESQEDENTDSVAAVN